jgi:phospholipid/cholesterol/gamma-HCH transport system substrate-binding protein
MNMRMTNEAKTGLIVIVCIAALAGLLMKVSNFNPLQKGSIIKTRFHFAAGVKSHSPVRLSGVDVGEVKGIRIIDGDETLVELDLWFRDGVRVRSDSKAFITTLGLMGEKYIEVKAGSAQTYAAEGDLIVGEDPVRLEDLVEKATKIGDDVSVMAKDISNLANRIDGAVVDNKPKLDHIFTNLEHTSENFRDFSEDIKWHPWKVLAKGKEKSRDEMARERKKKEVAAAGVETEVEPVKSKNNFSPADKSLATDS